MAEQVNQRIEGMINELEQMKRINLYGDDEIKEISRKRKEFEYRIQRRVKEKDDFVHYIAYELALLEDVSLRRKQAHVSEKRNDIEYAIAKRLNKIFKQFIYRFQNNIEIYFEYIKFCRSVGFHHAISGIIGQMLQIHGDKPKMWQMASKWESKEQKNYESARGFLLKGIHRHPESDILYLDLFEIELILAFKANDDEQKEICIKRADIVWKNGMKTVDDISFLFKICDLAMKCEVEQLVKSIKEEIWSRRDNKEVWIYIADKELEGYHWEEIEEYINEDYYFPKEIKNYICVYEEALQQFPDEKLCTKFIHGLLRINDTLCTDLQKIQVVKHAWMFGHENGVLSNEMYAFGIELLKLENTLSNDDFKQIIDSALDKNPHARFLWEEKLLLNDKDEKKKLAILKDAGKVLKADDYLHLWNILLDNIQTSDALKSCYDKFKNCEEAVLLAIKPKLLNKMYKCSGLKATRDLYEEFIRTPPTQIEVHTVMIDIEKSQQKPNLKNIRKCFECLVQHHGASSIQVWTDYINFETQNGSPQNSPAIYRRAIAALKKELVDEFIKNQTLSRIK
ncbi:U3 small nucleolar RNA-associated protein 6-like [Papilio xuthus]|uniref:U3 small nucleolar RNA-associated protein 6-like n=1 Tax=Papilio xuthus TaxID=66420 RepID=A0A194PFF5_PAPXU|nr:U3 small nucleolar RNA-associated protein 6-like [Papilio xuthus]